MSRGVRDLRDLICVSRLTIRDSDSDEEVLSDNGNVIKDLDALSLSSNSSVEFQHNVKTVAGQLSPDSGCVTNGSTPPEPSVDVKPKQSKTKKRKKKEKKRALELLPQRHELPKPEPLPPVAAAAMGDCVSEHDIDSESQPIVDKSEVPHNGNFDNILCYMDATIISGWLKRANEALHELSKYCKNSRNFVCFAHFWLSDFPDQQKNEIFEMEHGILLDELKFAFAVGLDQRKVTQRDLLCLVAAIFREYPGKLLSAKGPHLFLDYLDVLSSDRKNSYKKVLADVKCSTRNKQYAQWLLATRSFALVGVWSSVVNFFRNLAGKNAESPDLYSPTSSSEKEVHHHRVNEAIRQGFVDVMNYYFSSGHVSPHHKDGHNKTFIFTAVMHNQSSVLHYLINRVKPPIDINCAADTGNTALHAAANNGNVQLVTILLQNPRIDINAKNKQCDNATPLHLAVMLGNKDVTEKLMKMGADKNAKMGELTAREIAVEFGQEDLIPLFDK